MPAVAVNSCRYCNSEYLNEVTMHLDSVSFVALKDGAGVLAFFRDQTTKSTPVKIALMLTPTTQNYQYRRDWANAATMAFPRSGWSEQWGIIVIELPMRKWINNPRGLLKSVASQIQQAYDRQRRLRLDSYHYSR